MASNIASQLLSTQDYIPVYEVLFVNSLFQNLPLITILLSKHTNFHIFYTGEKTGLK